MTPQIQIAVSSSLTASQTTQITQTQQIQESTFSSSTIVTEVLTALRPLIVSSVNQAIAAREEKVTQITQTNSQFSQSELIAQIIAALQGPIRVSVADALASYNTNTQVTQVVQSPPVPQSPPSTASGVLDIFGDGKSHNVFVQTPEYQFQYNNN